MGKTTIGLIGTGSMGTVLGKLLIQAGYPLIAWNRTVSKTSDLQHAGSIVANDIAELVQPCDTIIICVSDYDVSTEILAASLEEKYFSGKTVLQLSTGTPKDAIDCAAKFFTAQANYLDGAIMVTPSQMGTAEAMILISGDETIYKQQEPLLKVLAPGTLYVGNQPSLAAAWDLALLSYFFSALIGFSHAAQIAGAEGIPIPELGSTVQSWSPAVGAIMKQAGDMIASGKYHDTESTVKTCYVSSKLILRHAQQAKISSTYPQFALGVFEKAIHEGLTSEDGVAIFKTL